MTKKVFWAQKSSFFFEKKEKKYKKTFDIANLRVNIDKYDKKRPVLKQLIA